MQAGLAVLGVRRWGDIEARVAMKVPKQDIEDVTSQALTGAFTSAFEGESMGEFVNLLHTITDRRIADYHRKHENRPKLVPLPGEHEEDEDVWGSAPAVGDFAASVDMQAVIDQALGELSGPHRLVVEGWLSGYPAKANAERVNNELGDALETPMSEDNVHQICRRFRVRLGELLDDDGVD